MATKKLGRGWFSPARDALPLKSPDEFRTHLSDARRLRIGDVAETGVADVPARIRELRVVEYVEEFTANLERHSFSEGEDLRHTEVGVVEARAMEETAVRGAETPAISARQNPRRPRPIWEYQSASGCGK